MPTFVLPLAGQQDLPITATFLARQHQDLGMVVNFVQPYTTNDLSMSAFFIPMAANNLPMTATFKKTSTLGMSATFNNPKHIVSLPMNAHFYAHTGTQNITGHATFKTIHNLPMTSTFVQSASAHLNMSALFQYKHTIPMSATFLQNSTNDLPMNVFFGRLLANLPMASTFIQSGSQDFNAAIVVQAYVQPHNILYSSQTSFPASITIKGLTTSDLLMSANFGYGGQNLNTGDFLAAITILNPYHGVANTPVHVGNENVAVYGVTEADGYFYINNLEAGTYVVYPQMTGVTFNPPSITVTITNQNVELTFAANGSFESETFSPVAIAPTNACVVALDNDIPGLFSIEGYILPSSQDFGQSVIVTASNEQDASGFRQTFGNNQGGGT
jgi:hypothetical protein